MSEPEKTSRNGLEQALTNVLNTQATMQQTLAMMMQAQAESAKAFQQIEIELTAIRNTLIRHEGLLTRLPEAVRERIGYQPGNQS